MPADKGPGSLLYGISRLQEYRITVHPRCRHTAAELAAYAWDKDDRGTLNRPRSGSDDHLMDALRYAMEDITFFRPTPPEPPPRRRYEHISADDMRGAWE